MRPAPYTASFPSRLRLHHAAEEERRMTSEGQGHLRMPSSEELKRVAELARSVAERQGLRVAVAGGLAMILYGSLRLTRDVDVVAKALPAEDAGLTRKEPLSFGGASYGTPLGIGLDWIVRDDDYRALYEEALDRAVPQREGFLVVLPEHLAAMKFATLRPKDYEDLMFLLGQPGLVDPGKATALVHRLLGGRFASDQFRAALEEARWRHEKDQGA